jgi:hypothetical protein
VAGLEKPNFPRATNSQWQLSGDELGRVDFCFVPIGDSRGKWKEPFATTQENRKLPFAMQR